MPGLRGLCYPGNKSSRSRWKWAIGAGIMATCLAGVAVIAGVSLAKWQARSSNHAAAQEQTILGLTQLPVPGSDAAKQLLAAPNTPDWVKTVYLYQQDSEIVTPELTESFLKLFQQHLQKSAAVDAAPAPAAAAAPAPGSGANLLVDGKSSRTPVPPAASKAEPHFQSSSSDNKTSSSTSIDLAAFVRVAHDVLSYLRFCRSTVLLQLLREFSTTGGISLDATDPDLLQAEMLHLLNLTSLNHWYKYTTTKDGLEHHVQAAAAHGTHATSGRHLLSTAAADSQHHDQFAAAKKLQERPHRMLLSQDASADALLSTMTGGSSSSSAGTAALSLAAGTTTLSSTGSGSTVSGIAGSTTSATSIATGSAKAAASFAVQPAVDTESAELTLQDMLCSVKQYSPTGLTGVAAGVLDCSNADTLATAPPNTGFTPVEIPIAFHLLRFLQAGTLLPPDWDAQKAAENLVDVANRLYFGTGISFKLHEVRTDPAQYPYLQLPTLEGWQACTHNGVDATGGVACLRRLAQDPEVSTLVDKQVINVFVSGSVDQAAYCDKPQTPAPGCTTVSLGYCEARGPWFSTAAGRSPSWSEDSPAENWMFISHDMFNPSTRNSVRFWNGGGATLAHEIGHYLGLMHTHEGVQPCDANPTKTDAVLDTPPNQAIDAYAASTNTLSGLAGWCSDFRLGRQPSAEELQQFNSCQGSDHIDNVFNLQSYVPDPCMMAFTPRQVERLHWAITSFRPKLVAAYST